MDAGAISLEAWALGWLRRQGIDVRDQDFEAHASGWSTVIEFDTSVGSLWAKQGAPGSRHEAVLVPALARLRADDVVTPLAHDLSTGALLLRDGGAVLGERQPPTDPDAISTWSGVLARYGALQRAAEPLVDELLTAGVPDLRPRRLAALVEHLLLQTDLLRVGNPEGITADEHAALDRHLENMDALCSSATITPTVDHNDLNRSNVFADDGRIFEWGDAVIGHPFASLRRGLEIARCQPAPAVAREALLRIYIAPWMNEVPLTQLHKELQLAPMLGAVAAASTWARLPPAVNATHPTSLPRKLRELLGCIEHLTA